MGSVWQPLCGTYMNATFLCQYFSMPIFLKAFGSCSLILSNAETSLAPLSSCTRHQNIFTSEQSHAVKIVRPLRSECRLTGRKYSNYSKLCYPQIQHFSKTSRMCNILTFQMNGKMIKCAETFLSNLEKKARNKEIFEFREQENFHCELSKQRTVAFFALL